MNVRRYLRESELIQTSQRSRVEVLVILKQRQKRHEFFERKDTVDICYFYADPLFSCVAD